MRTILCMTLSTVLAFCGGDDDDDAPPPPASTAPNTIAAPAAPAGQVMVTVAANSNPPGASVTGGGRSLGVTPLQTQVPVPAPQPGQVQTFAFTFQLEGYQPATINAAPVNNTIALTATLAPAVAPVAVGGDEDDGDPGQPAGNGRVLRVNGRGGGRIFDNHTTRGTASVSEQCTIARLQVRLNGRHSYYGDLHIAVTDPGGRSYSLARGGRANPFRTHTVRRAAGRQARGQWSLSIADRLNADTGVLNGWTLSIECQ